MRILFLSREYPPETNYGGIGSYVATIAPALTQRGHDVHVLSCVRGQVPTDTKDRGVYIHRRQLRHIPGLGKFIRLPATVARLSASVSCLIEMNNLRLNPDVIEIPDWLAEGLLVTFKPGTPTVSFLHTPLCIIERYARRLNKLDTALASSLERLSVRRAQIVTSPTHRLVRLLAQKDNWLRRRDVEIVRLPIETEAWEQVDPVRTSRPTVLCTGRLENRKAPEILVKAAAKLVRVVPDLEVLFVGASAGLRDGLSYEHWLKRLAADLESPCKFLGQVPRDQLPGLLGQSRVVVVPSRDDNFPMAGVEGMAAGRPIVCSEDVGLVEILRGTQAGTIVPTDDPQALADALQTYLEDPVQAQEAGAAAQVLVRQECGAHMVASKREQLYAQAIAAIRPRAF